MSDNIKLDYLWKRAKGVANTSDGKAPHNESMPSYDPVFQDQIWVKTDYLPIPAPTTIPEPTPAWNDYLNIYMDGASVGLTRDLTTADGKSWVALRDPLLGLERANLLMDWIPPRLHNSYRIKVYAGSPASQTQTAIRLYPDTQGYEWEFDYAAGALNFFNSVPASVLERGVWVEGWRYIGPKGGGLTKDDLSPSFTGKDFTLTLPPLAAQEFYDFELETAGACTLVKTTVDAAAVVECHSTPEREDTNPYRFVSTPDHLVDDGSYVVAGRRLYGPRFCILQNLFRPEDGVTYWRVYNDDPELIKAITVTVRSIPRV